MLIFQSHLHTVLIILTCGAGMGFSETYDWTAAMLGEPIGFLHGRCSKEINPVGSTLGVNLNVGTTVTESDLDKLADLGWQAQIRFQLKK